MERNEIFDIVESIWDECQERNIGENEAELDFRETITDWIHENTRPKITMRGIAIMGGHTGINAQVLRIAMNQMEGAVLVIGDSIKAKENLTEQMNRLGKQSSLAGQAIKDLSIELTKYKIDSDYDYFDRLNVCKEGWITHEPKQPKQRQYKPIRAMNRNNLKNKRLIKQSVRR